MMRYNGRSERRQKVRKEGWVKVMKVERREKGRIKGDRERKYGWEKGWREREERRRYGGKK
jgi:hypothetical protein